MDLEEVSRRVLAAVRQQLLDESTTEAGARATLSQGSEVPGPAPGGSGIGSQIANPRVVEANSSFVSPNHASPPHMYSAGAAISIQQSLQGLNDQLHQSNQHEVENQLGQLFCPYGTPRASTSMGGQRVTPYSLPGPGQYGCTSASRLRHLRTNALYSRPTGRVLPERSFQYTAPIRPTPWSTVLYFLGEPEEKRRPTVARQNALEKAKLCSVVIKTDLSRTAEEFLREILKIFDDQCRAEGRPNSTTPGFAFHLGGIEGSGNKEIVFFGRPQSPLDLKQRGVKKLYARPTMCLLPIHEEPDDEDYVTVVGRRGTDRDDTTASSPAATAADSPGEGSTLGERGAAYELNSPRSSVSSPTNESREAPVPDIRRGTAEPSGSRTSTIPRTSSDRAAGFRFEPDLSHITSVYELQEYLQLVHPGIQTINSPQLGKELLPLESILPRFISSIDPDEEAQIQIAESEAIDAGGVMRSFAWKMGLSIQDGKYNGVPILEGLQGNYSISACLCLQNDLVYAMVGKYLAFSIRNTGLGMFGLNPLFVSMLCSEGFPSAQEINVTDVPDADAIQVIAMLQLKTGDEELRFNELEKPILANVLSSIRWGYPLTPQNIVEVIGVIKTYFVVECRKASIIQMRQAFLTTDTGRWVSAHPELWGSLFPPMSALRVTADNIMEALVYEEQVDSQLIYLRQYLETLEDAGALKLRGFVEAVTGHPYLGNGKITLAINDSLDSFTVHTCSSELELKTCASYDDFKEKMDFFLRWATYGFDTA